MWRPTPPTCGLALDAQLAAATAAINGRGWALAGGLVDAGIDGGMPPERRPALGPALEALDAAGARNPVVACQAAVRYSLTRPLGQFEAVGRWRLAVALALVVAGCEPPRVSLGQLA